MVIDSVNKALDLIKLFGSIARTPAVILSAAENRHGMKPSLNGICCAADGFIYVNPDQDLEELKDTINHELAHYVQHFIFPDSLDHGQEFRALALAMGAKPDAYGLPKKTFKYCFLEKDGKVIVLKRKKSGYNCLLEVKG